MASQSCHHFWILLTYWPCVFDVYGNFVMYIEMRKKIDYWWDYSWGVRSTLTVNTHGEQVIPEIPENGWGSTNNRFIGIVHKRWHLFSYLRRNFQQKNLLKKKVFQNWANVNPTNSKQINVFRKLLQNCTTLMQSSTINVVEKFLRRRRRDFGNDLSPCGNSKFWPNSPWEAQ